MMQPKFATDNHQSLRPWQHHFLTSERTRLVGQPEETSHQEAMQLLIEYVHHADAGRLDELRPDSVTVGGD